MADRKPKNNLSDLINGVEKDHKAEIQLYISGHLNPSKFYKPRRTTKHNIWASGKKSAFITAKRRQVPTPRTFTEITRETKCTLADFTGNARPTSGQTRSTVPSYYQSQASQHGSGTPASVFSGTSWEIRSSETAEKTDEGAGILQKPYIKEELDIPELKMLKYKPTMNSRLCVTEETKDEYQFLPSYLAGVTKTDQFHRFMQFQRDFIAKKDLLENDFIGSKSAEQHEKKLAQVSKQVAGNSYHTHQHKPGTLNSIDKLIHINMRKKVIWLLGSLEAQISSVARLAFYQGN